MTRLGKPFALAAIVTTLVCSASPPPAAALNPIKPICSLAGLVSTLAGKICSAASHAGRVIDAGKQLLGGHLGSSLKDLVGGGGGSAAAGRALSIGAMAVAVVAGARFVMRETAAVISATTRPELGSTWFSAFYWRMAAVAALLTVPFLCAAAIQALLRSDLAMLARSALGYLPLGLLGVSIAAPLTTLLLSGSDELSHLISSAAGNSDTAFLDKAVVGVGGLTLLSHSPFVAFFVALLAIAATLVLWCELLIRSAAVYVIVLMLPLFFASLVWPARRVWAIRAVELLIALILAKFAIVAVLALGGAAMGHTLIPSVTSMLAGATLMLLAAFSPWALLRLLPLHELAAGAVHGLRMHPGQQLALETARADDAATARGERTQSWLERGGEHATAARSELERLNGGRPEDGPADGIGGLGGDGLGGGGLGDGGGGGGLVSTEEDVAIPGLYEDPTPPVDPGFHAADGEWDTLHLHPAQERYERPVFGRPGPEPPGGDSGVLSDGSAASSRGTGALDGEVRDPLPTAPEPEDGLL